MPTKKTLVVVKNLRDISPKKQLIIARQLQDSDDLSTLKPSLLGNASPQRPVRNNEGTIVARSILGDPAMFEAIEKKKRAQSSPSSRMTRISTSNNQNVFSSENSPRSDDDDEEDTLNVASSEESSVIDISRNIIEDIAPGDELLRDPEEYLRTLKHQQDKSAEVRQFEKMFLLQSSKSNVYMPNDKKTITINI